MWYTLVIWEQEPPHLTPHYCCWMLPRVRVCAIRRATRRKTCSLSTSRDPGVGWCLCSCVAALYSSFTLSAPSLPPLQAAPSPATRVLPALSSLRHLRRAVGPSLYAALATCSRCAAPSLCAVVRPAAGDQAAASSAAAWKPLRLRWLRLRPTLVALLLPGRSPLRCSARRRQGWQKTAASPAW